jgi:hypothetical protein
MTLAYAAYPPSARCITVVIYCVMDDGFVMDDGLESFSSEIMPNLKKQFEFI